MPDLQRHAALERVASHAVAYTCACIGAAQITAHNIDNKNYL
ncbi:MAG: hypothetical protein ACI9RO_000502 [Alteromonas macleodii]|jgi:hypothetical protein